MKIENPAALRFIMQDDIYLLPTDKTDQPTTIAQPVLETKIAELNYLGKHKKRFLIVTHYANEEYMAAEHITALENILKRKEYDLEDVAIFNRATYPEVNFEELQAYFKPQKLLLLGKNALPDNALALTFNQPRKIEAYDALYTFSFDEMMDNTANKKAFWDQMKIYNNMQQLVFATNNAHKLQEVAAKIKGRMQLLSLNDIGCNDDIDETGTTFSQNASIKSHYIYNKYHLNCFGDDSGLEIDALGGQPGVYSARYAGGHGNHAANNQKVLEALKSADNRKARFCTVISLIWNGDEYFFEGTVEGTIREELNGTAGFGYDPIFQPDGFNVTFAEMSLEEKNNISHRAKAMDGLLNFLNTAV